MADYSIWVCEYAYITAIPNSMMVYGAHNAGTVRLPLCYVVVKSKDHVAMVDVGYNDKDYGKIIGDKFGCENWRSPKDVLSEIGLTPEDVDTCFITHAHFDHFGNVEDFPNATFYIQEREISKWVWAMSLPEQLRWMLVSIDPGDIIRGVELARDGRLVTVNGDMDNVLPGIDLYAAPDSHTWGCMWVNVRNDGKTDSDDNWVLAGDLVYVYDNMHSPGANTGVEEVYGAKEVYTPVGLAIGSQANLVLATHEMMKKVEGDSKRIIPVHEDRLKDNFPHRVSKEGLRVTEVCLADGETSKVSG